MSAEAKNQKSNLPSKEEQISLQGTVLNSYKFAKPRIYVKNNYESQEISKIDHLKYIASNIGPKKRSPGYNSLVDRMLQLSKPKKSKKTKNSIISINNIDFKSPSLKTIRFLVLNNPINALVDTGSTHCLISTKTFQALPDTIFTPVKIHMKVAGSVLKNNIIGSTTLLVTFSTCKGPMTIPLDFLVAHAINGYQAILGATILMNSDIISALTPDKLILSSHYRESSIKLETAEKNPQFNFLQCNNITLLPDQSKRIIASLHPPLSENQTDLLFHTLNSDIVITHGTKISSNSAECIIQNKSDSTILLSSSEHFAMASSEMHTSVSEQNNSEFSDYPHESDNPHESDYSEHSEIEPSIDEQIISEHQLLDPSDLDKRFSYKDCEINPNLSKNLRSKLDAIISENQTVFATSKLDVGKFKGFTVQLEIDTEITPEKQRFMSDEKLHYCEKTFKEFEALGLVQQCHTPKTVSNLLLVPKYEGLRDLTKASVYLAQVKGTKNSSFRIVQDLRRINVATKNIKKSAPKLPEFIFQKLQGKVVSSVDCNMAYWHLILHPDSRPWTCFYLKGRILQFARMPQGLASAPACWDEAMSMIFSTQTMSDIKLKLTPSEANSLPDDFEEFFTYFQDDSWIFSDNDDMHLLHIKVVLMAYKMHDIKLSPSKSTFFPDSFKILGVTISPHSAELSLDEVKAKSILDWEKPDSLYSLQSRLYALNYWNKFIPALSELKFPLQQIVRSQIFSWNEEADLAWERIKSIIALDIRLTIPEKHEKLILTTDASKVACSCILWVFRDKQLKVVGCYSKLFSHTDSMKSIHFKETYAMVLAFDHFRAYLLNTLHPITVFTDARALLWVGRNREYSIACNGLVNKLAKIQLEIPHVVYSVPSEVNYLADLFSRAFSSSRFLEKTHFTLSKIQANNLPPLTTPCVLSESALYEYFATPLHSEFSDNTPRKRTKISTPKPISSLYKLFRDCTPEEKYYSAIRLLQGWNDPSLTEASFDNPELNSNLITSSQTTNSSNEDLPFIAFEKKDKELFKHYADKVIAETMKYFYSDLSDPHLSDRIKATLKENYTKLYRQNFINFLRSDFLKHETMLSSMDTGLREVKKLSRAGALRVKPKPRKISDTIVNYTLMPTALHHPMMNDCLSIDIPVQSDITVPPNTYAPVDTLVRLFVPNHLQLRLAPADKSLKLDLHLHSTVLDSSYTNTVKILLCNNTNFPVDI